MAVVRPPSRVLAGPLRLGNLLLDEERYQVHVNGKRVWLTYLEFRLLVELAARSGSVVTRDELLNRVWGDPATPARRLDVLTSRLRANLHALDGWAIVTARKRGYALVPRPKGAPSLAVTPGLEA